jgi:protein O-mannosyl-transferase
MRTPGGQGAAPYLPLLTALLFVLHPLQTQAVTYIVQRASVLAALFYILTLSAYLKARLAQKNSWRGLWAGVALGLGLAAFFSKSNSASLPLALVALELLLLQPARKHIAYIIAAATLLLLGVWIIAALSFGYNPWSMQTFAMLSRETHTYSRLDYFATQVQVLWRYIGLFVWPLELHLDRDIALTQLRDPLTLVALFAHAGIVALALYWRRYALPVFAVVFYYVAHSVESSFLPIRDVMFEHRTYLPNLGLSLLLAWGLLYLRTQQIIAPWILGLSVGLLLFLALVTWQRNDMWRDPVLLWQHNTQMTPHKDRPWGILGKHLLEEGRAAEAAKVLEYTLALQREQQQAANPLDIINLVVALRHLQRENDALALVEYALSMPLSPSERAKLLINKGNIYYSYAQRQRAEELYRKALTFDPQNLEARANLANALYQRGEIIQALNLYEELLRIVPNHPQFRANYTLIRSHLNSSP